MERLGLVGLTWRQGGTEALARFTLDEADRRDRLPELADALETSEIVYLATCNRVEIAFVTEGADITSCRRRVFEVLTGAPAAPGEAERALRAYAGEGAVEHLFVVSAGLDSARPGETEIAGQIRQAYETSRSLALIGMRLELVFEQALRVAARVHETTAVAEGRTSLAEIAIDRLRERLRRTPGALATVGVSPMTERAAATLRDEIHQLVHVNRTRDRAEVLARTTGGVARALEEFVDTPDPVEAVLLATASPDPVLPRASLERLAARAPSGEPPLVVDMAVPPDVDPEDARAVGVERLGMEEIIAIAEENRRERLVDMADARTIVDEALVDIRRRIAERRVAPVLAALQRRYRRTALEGVERLFKRDLRGLGEDEREAIRRWAETLARRFAHIPTQGLRGLASDADGEAIDAFLASLDTDLAEELRVSARRADERGVPKLPAEEGS